jgi:hypothetical protein
MMPDHDLRRNRQGNPSKRHDMIVPGRGVTPITAGHGLGPTTGTNAVGDTADALEAAPRLVEVVSG